MSFILRVTLVIGVLSYFAAQRDGDVRPAAEVKAIAERQGAPITALAEKLPSEMSAAANQAVTTELVRRFSIEGASRDTLLAVDRRPAWRGTDIR